MNIKIDELKTNVNSFVLNAIDEIFPPNNIYNKFIGSSAKIFYQQKQQKLLSFLDSLADENGEVDTDVLFTHYNETLFSEGSVKIDLDEVGTKLGIALPSKQIVLTREDLKKILKK